MQPIRTVELEATACSKFIEQLLAQPKTGVGLGHVDVTVRRLLPIAGLPEAEDTVGINLRGVESGKLEHLEACFCSSWISVGLSVNGRSSQGCANFSSGYFGNPYLGRQHNYNTAVKVSPFEPEFFGFMEYLIGQAGYEAKVSSQGIDLLDGAAAEKVIGQPKSWEEDKLYYSDGSWGIGTPTEQMFSLFSLHPEPHLRARALVLSLAEQGAQGWEPIEGGLSMHGTIPFSTYKNDELIDTLNELHDGIFELEFSADLSVKPEDFADLIQETTNFVLPLAYTELRSGGVSWYVEARDGKLWVSADADEGVGVKKIEKLFENCGVEKEAIQTYE